MKAIVLADYGGAEKLTCGDAAIPKPGANEILVRVRAASVNPVDQKLAAGKYKDNAALHFPWIPGKDFSGHVEAVGKDVIGFKKGDEVFGDCEQDGGYAEFVVVPAETLALKPARLGYAEAASLPVAAQTAWQGLFDHGKLEAGQTVLIHGAAGAVGAFAVQFAKQKGAIVIATASARNAAYLKELKADKIIDYDATDFEKEVRDVDLVFDTIGGDTQKKSFNVLKKGGRLIATSAPPAEDLARTKGVTAMMMHMKASKKLLEKIGALVANAEIKAKVSKTFKLAEAKDAWDYLEKKGKEPGKIVLEVEAE